MTIIKNYKKNIKRFKRKIYFDRRDGKNNYKLYPNNSIEAMMDKKDKIIFSNFFHLPDGDYTKEEMLSTFSEINKMLSKNYKKIDLRQFKSIFDYIVDIGVQKIRNKARVMSELDREFNKSMQYGWQEVFKFKEVRKNRTILTFDVNSQYPDSMIQENYTMIEKMKIDTKVFNLKKYTNGQALVDITINDEWFEKIFPHYTYFDGVRYYNNQKTITNMWMNVNELKAYEKYITINKIHKVIYSDKAIEHYLSNTIRHFYNLRLESVKGSLREKIIKNILVGLHSVTNGTSNRKYQKKFKSKNDMINFFKEMNLPVDDLEGIKYINNNSFKVDNVYEKDNEFMLEYSEFDHRNRSVISSLSATVFANSRVKIFKLIEILKESKVDFDLCYINIDSLHISIENKDRDSIMNLLYNKNILGKELGQWKLEAEGDFGMWFEPGRYWIKKDNELIKAANIVIYDGTDKSYLQESRKISYIDEFGYTVKTPHYVYLGFVSKIIENNDFIRVNKITLDERIKITKIKKYNFSNFKKSFKKSFYN